MFHYYVQNKSVDRPKIQNLEQIVYVYKIFFRYEEVMKFKIYTEVSKFSFPYNAYRTSSTLTSKICRTGF